MTEAQKYFLAHAAECESRARNFEDANAREMLLFVADRWRALAASERPEGTTEFPQDKRFAFMTQTER